MSETIYYERNRDVILNTTKNYYVILTKNY